MAGGRARDIVGHARLPGRADGPGPGLAHRPGTAAAPIDDAQRDELSESLGALAGAPVELQVEVDESLLSGAVIQIGDLQVDATARGRSTPCAST